MNRTEFLAHQAPSNPRHVIGNDQKQMLLLTQAACSIMAGNPELPVHDAVDKALEAYHQVHEAFAKAHEEIYQS